MYIFRYISLSYAIDDTDNYIVVCQKIKYDSWKTGSNYTLGTV